MRFNEQTLEISWIDSEDETYRITTEARMGPLVDSIKKVGLINTPLLIEKPTSGPKPEFTIVSGFRRVEACRRLGYSSIKVRIVAPNTSRLECIKLAIIDNALQRPLNLIEASRSIFLLSAFFSDNNSLAQEASSLGLPASPTFINKIKNICRLPWPIQNGILANTISLSMALELSLLEQDAGVALANLFRDLKLSLNKQREIFTLVKEIALREDMSIIEVIEEDCLQEILNNENLDRTQKTREIRSYLKKRRFPALTKAEEEFKKQIKKLKLGNGAKLIPPHNFEGNTYTLSLYFKNEHELNDRLALLKRIMKKS